MPVHIPGVSSSPREETEALRRWLNIRSWYEVRTYDLNDKHAYIRKQLLTSGANDYDNLRKRDGLAVLA